MSRSSRRGGKPIRVNNSLAQGKWDALNVSVVSKVRTSKSGPTLTLVIEGYLPGDEPSGPVLQKVFQLGMQGRWVGTLHGDKYAYMCECAVRHL